MHWLNKHSQCAHVEKCTSSKRNARRLTDYMVPSPNYVSLLYRLVLILVLSLFAVCTHNIGKTESEASDVACDRHMNVCVRELDCYSTAMLGTNECSNGSGRAHLTIQADECVCGTRIRCGTEKDKTVCSSRCTQCCCCSLNGAVLHQCTAKDLYTYQLLVLNARVFFMFISCSVDCCVFFFLGLLSTVLSSVHTHASQFPCQ